MALETPLHFRVIVGGQPGFFLDTSMAGQAFLHRWVGIKMSFVWEDDLPGRHRDSKWVFGIRMAQFAVIRRFGY
jgi:hypothetical protein